MELELTDVLVDPPFAERHHRIVARPIDEVWPACREVTGREIRTLGPLMALRHLPQRLLGRTAVEPAAEVPLIDAFVDEGFIMLRNDPEPVDGRAVILFGAAGRFWSPTGNRPRPFTSPRELVDFAEPGWAKTVCRLEAIDRGDGTTRIETETVVAGTDPGSTGRFAPYWAIIRGPSGLIRRSWLAAIDRRTASADGPTIGLGQLYPRPADGLPPGQRELSVFPRFSDQPLRPAPEPAPIALDLLVEGARLATIGADDLDRFELRHQTSDFHCVTTWSHRQVEWSGYRLAEVLADVVGPELPPYLVASAADGQEAVLVTEDVVAPDVLLATHLGHRPLDARHGAPLRLVSPRQYGYKNLKHLTAIDFRSREPASTLGPKEHLRARVAAEERHARWPAWMVRLPYRLTVAPTAWAAERSLRTS